MIDVTGEVRAACAVDYALLGDAEQVFAAGLILRPGRKRAAGIFDDMRAFLDWPQGEEPEPGARPPDFQLDRGRVLRFLHSTARHVASSPRLLTVILRCPRKRASKDGSRQSCGGAVALAEVGCFRLRPTIAWPNSGTPEFGWLPPLSRGSRLRVTENEIQSPTSSH